MLLRDVPPAQWNAAARAYAGCGAVLEGRYTADDAVVTGPLVVMAQVLDVVETNATLRDAEVVSIHARVSRWDPDSGDTTHGTVVMRWNADTLAWRAPTGISATCGAQQYVEALHGRVVKYDETEVPAPLPRQFLWHREDAVLTRSTPQTR